MLLRTSSGGESTRAPPVAQSPVLEDLPENGVGDARRALRRRPGAARRRASGRRGGSAEEARNHFGRRCGHGGAAARQQRAESKQLLVVLQNVLLIGTGEAHSINDVYDIDNFLSVYVSIILKTEPRHLLKSFSAPGPDDDAVAPFKRGDVVPPAPRRKPPRRRGLSLPPVKC